MLWLIYTHHWRRIQAVIPFVLVSVYFGYVFWLGNHLGIGDRFVRYAVACIVVQVVALGLITLALLAGKIIGAQRQERRAVIDARIGELLAQHVAGAGTEEHRKKLIALAKQHPDEFLNVWENSLRALKGNSEESIRQLFTETGLAKTLLTQVRSASPSRALRAIFLLRRLESDPESTKAIESALDHPIEAVRSSAAISLAGCGSPQQQERVLERLPRLPFWLRVAVIHQLADDSPTLQTFLETAFRSGEPRQVLTALEYILSQNRVHAAGAVAHLAKSPNVEVRIKFFRALPLLITEEDSAKLVSTGLLDSDWRVRVMAVLACGKLRLAGLVPLLVERLAACTQKIEASHLAHALAAIGPESKAKLESFLESEIPLARAVAASVLEEQLLQPVQRGAR